MMKICQRINIVIDFENKYYKYFWEGCDYTILIDIDGVCLDMTSSIRDELKVKGIDFNPSDIIRYNFDGISTDIKSEIYKLFDSKNLYMNQLPYQRVLKAIQLLKDNNISFRAYTSVSKPYLLDTRVTQCKALGFKKYSIYTCDKPIIQNYDILIEDCLKNITEWIEAGMSDVKFLLIDQPYNQEVHNKDFKYWDKVIRCKDLYDAVKNYVICA